MKSITKRLSERSMLPVAIVQLTEHRHCSCGRVYPAPNNHLLVRFKAKAGKTTSTAALSEVKLALDCMNLPRVHQDIHTSIEACESCFGESSDQLVLFPSYTPAPVPPPEPAWCERERAKLAAAANPLAKVNGKKVAATPLDAF